MHEEWRAVSGWPYEVSNYGEVRRIGRAPSIRKPALNGYRYVTLCNGTDQKVVTVHSLVAEAFIGPRPHPAAVVNHIDGVKTNNCVANLEYTTHRRNMREAVRLGLQPIGERHPNATLRDVDVAAIRACAAAGKTDAEIGIFFGVHKDHIGKILRGERRVA